MYCLAVSVHLTGRVKLVTSTGGAEANRCGLPRGKNTDVCTLNRQTAIFLNITAPEHTRLTSLSWVFWVSLWVFL